MGPVGSIQALSGRPLAHPATDLLVEGGGDLGGGAGSVAGLQACQAPIQVGIEPALHGTRAHAQRRRDVLAWGVALGQANNIEAVAQPEVGGGMEGFLQP
jgi:hypothetical protein